MARESTLSLTVMVIILALLGLFIGYLLGNWFIQLVTGDDATVSNQLLKEKVIEEEIIVEDEEASSSNFSLGTGQSDYQDMLAGEQLEGDVYVVQVGAFRNRENAEKLQEELAVRGFQAIITEGVPYKVQLGATNDRSEAKELAEKIESLGYEAFVTH